MALHPVDIHVGKRLRSRRTILGMSQEELGDAVGVTFQQIQKYERGLNRIGASRLFDFSNILNVGVSYFFEGLNDELAEEEKIIDEATQKYGDSQFNNKEVLSLVRSYFGINDNKIRKRILSLVKTLSDESDNGIETGDNATKANAA